LLKNKSKKNQSKLSAATTFTQNFVFRSDTEVEMGRPRVQKQGEKIADQQHINEAVYSKHIFPR